MYIRTFKEIEVRWTGDICFLRIMLKHGPDSFFGLVYWGDWPRRKNYRSLELWLILVAFSVGKMKLYTICSLSANWPNKFGKECYRILAILGTLWAGLMRGYGLLKKQGEKADIEICKSLLLFNVSMVFRGIIMMRFSTIRMWTLNYRKLLFMILLLGVVCIRLLGIILTLTQWVSILNGDL